MLKKIEDLEHQVCFFSNGFIFCNWVEAARQPGYGILSDTGKWLRFEDNESNREKLKKKNPDS